MCAAPAAGRAALLRRGPPRPGVAGAGGPRVFAGSAAAVLAASAVVGGVLCVGGLLLLFAALSWLAAACRCCWLQPAVCCLFAACCSCCSSCSRSLLLLLQPVAVVAAAAAAAAAFFRDWRGDLPAGSFFLPCGRGRATAPALLRGRSAAAPDAPRSSAGRVPATRRNGLCFKSTGCFFKKQSVFCTGRSVF